ncbi:MAG: hypothetical protein KC636_01825 [Myxococcales bacterium]|nr:hypothetical protein [Myxococcales bacterium]
MAAPEPRAEVHFLTGVQWERRVMLLVALELLAIAAYFTPDALAHMRQVRGAGYILSLLGIVFGALFGAALMTRWLVPRTSATGRRIAAVALALVPGLLLLVALRLLVNR